MIIVLSSEMVNVCLCANVGLTKAWFSTLIIYFVVKSIIIINVRENGKVKKSNYRWCQGRLEANTVDVNNLVDVYCSSKPRSIRILNCQHVSCAECILRLPEVPHPVYGRNVMVRHCPDCRTIITSSTAVLTSAFRLAWRADIESEFGAANMPQDHAQDGQRPADATLDEQLEETSRQLAVALQGSLSLSHRLQATVI